MACPRIDLHIHTRYLRCANATMEVPAIVAECERLGLTAIALTDHLNSRDQAPLHADIRNDILRLQPQIDVHFGVELNFLDCDGDFACDQELMASCGFAFAIGGIHSCYLDEYDPRKIVDVQHRHHLRTCRDPLVKVLVHPYWFSSGEFTNKGWPRLESMEHVPASYARELGQTARDTGTAIEINAGAVLDRALGERWVDSYLDYLRVVAAEGPLFSVASDAHDIGSLQKVAWAWSAVEQLGLPPERIWSPSTPPLAPGRPAP